ncbi:MAG: hypothetical protein DRI44_02250 [Chlamydiae bacterium]|nr:MAG: hypothetical protein DRI44_02250 [Chlamydiota bacterium]
MINVQILPEPKSAKFNQQTLNLRKRLSGKVLQSLDKTIKNFPLRVEKSLVSVGLKVKFIEVDKFSEQEYKIEIGTKGIIVFGGGINGLFHGYQSLLQILSQCENKIPCGIIQDTPDIKTRSYHLDLRSHKYKASYIKTLFRELAKLKFNTVVIEYQDTFPFSKEKFVTGDIHFSKEQITELNKAANDVGIELIPYQNILGQLDYILDLEPYSNLSVKSDAISFKNRKLDISNNKAVKFIAGLLDDLSSNHISKKIFLGTANITSNVEDNDSLYEKKASYLAAIAKLLANKGKTPIVWANLFNKCPDVLSELPEKTVIVASHTSTQTELSKQIKLFSDTGLTPAASATILQFPDNEFARDTSRAIQNIIEASKIVKKSAANGLFVCSSTTIDAAAVKPINGYPVDFMSGSRRMHIGTTWFAISAAAEFAWNISNSDEKNFSGKWPLFFFGSNEKKLAQIQHYQIKDYFSGATNAEITRDRKRIIKLIGELKPPRRREILAFIEFYARLAIHAVHVRQIFSHSPKKQEIALLRGEIARLKDKHSGLMKESLYSREISEEQNHLFGHTELLLKRLTRK